MSGTPQMPSKSPALLGAAQGRQRMEGKRQNKKAKEGLCKKRLSIAKQPTSGEGKQNCM